MVLAVEAVQATESDVDCYYLRCTQNCHQPNPQRPWNSTSVDATAGGVVVELLLHAVLPGFVTDSWGRLLACWVAGD